MSRASALNDTLEPEDILGGCLFLASQSSKMMTGQAMVVDGGVVVPRDEPHSAIGSL